MTEAPQNKFLENIIEKSAEADSLFIVANAKINHHPVIYCSQEFSTEFVFTRHAVTKKDVYCSFLYGAQTKIETKKKLEEAVRNKKRTQLEIVLYNRFEVKKWYLLTFVPVNETDGDVALFLLLFNSITHLKPALKDTPKRQWKKAVRTILKKPNLEAFRKSIDDKKATKHKKSDMETIYNRTGNLFISEYGIEIKVPKFLINHVNPHKVTWDMLLVVCILYTCILVPFVISFQYTNTFIVAVDTLVDIMFTIDIILTFFTTYVDSNEKLVTNSKQIRIVYLKGWFVLDVVAAVPYSAITYFLSNSFELNTIKVVRLLRIGKVGKKIKRHMHRSSVTLGLWILMFCLCAHWMACIWYAISMYIDKPAVTKHTWLAMLASVTDKPYRFTSSGSVVENTGPSYPSLYISALYYTMSSLTTCGFGNIAPNTSAEKLFGCVTMLLGCVLYALIFGQVTNVISQFQKNSNEYTDQLNSIRRFNSIYKIPLSIAKRLENYFTATWAVTKGTNEEEILNGCPRDLQSDLCSCIHSKVLKGSNPAFSHLNETSLRVLSRYFWTIRTSPGDKLIMQGESVDKLYFAASGSLEVKNGKDLVGLIGPGDAFGKMLSTNDGERSVYDVQANSFGTIHCISCEAVNEALELYPEQYKAIKFDLVLSFDITQQIKVMTKDGELFSTELPDSMKAKESNGTDLYVNGDDVDFEQAANSNLLAGMSELKGELRRETERMNSKMGVVEAQMRLVLKLLRRNNKIEVDPEIGIQLNELESHGEHIDDDNVDWIVADSKGWKKITLNINSSKSTEKELDTVLSVDAAEEEEEEEEEEQDVEQEKLTDKFDSYSNKLQEFISSRSKNEQRLTMKQSASSTTVSHERVLNEVEENVEIINL